MVVVQLSEEFHVILAVFIDGLYLNAEDSDFVNFITADIAGYLCQAAACKDRVLVFPPIFSRYRFLIHRVIEEEFPVLCSFSVGEGDERRTVVCLRELGMNSGNAFHTERKSAVEYTSSKCVKKKNEKGSTKNLAHVSCQAGCLPIVPGDQDGVSKGKTKKPDMPLYVPRGRRLAAESGTNLGEDPKTEAKSDSLESDLLTQISEDRINTCSCVTPENDLSAAKTKCREKKKASKKTSESYSDNCSQKKTKTSQKTNKNLVPSNNSLEKFSIVSANAMKDDCVIAADLPDPAIMDLSNPENGGLVAAAKTGIDTYDLNTAETFSCLTEHKDSDVDIYNVVPEEDRAAASNDIQSELSISSSLASSKNLVAISESLVTNGIDFDLPGPDTVPGSVEHTVTGNDLSASSLQKTVPVPVGEPSANEEQSWDALFDDSGEALHPDVIKEITNALGAVTVQKPQFDYLNYQPREPEISEEEFEHLIEIYDFPASLQTVDIATAFKDFQDAGFEIKWVDDTHAIGVFSGRTAARSAIATFYHPLIKVRPIQHAARQTKLKAKKCTEFLLPYKPRPVMVASVARNLVAGALGLQSRVSKEKREEERLKLKAARDQKRETKRLKDEAWEGKIGKCTMDET